MGRKKRGKTLAKRPSINSESDQTLNGLENDEKSVITPEKDPEPPPDTSQKLIEKTATVSHKKFGRIKYLTEIYNRRSSSSSQEDDEPYIACDLLPVEINNIILGTQDEMKINYKCDSPRNEDDKSKKTILKENSPELFQVKKNETDKCYSPKKINHDNPEEKINESVISDMKDEKNKSNEKQEPMDVDVQAENLQNVQENEVASVVLEKLDLDKLKLDTIIKDSIDKIDSLEIKDSTNTEDLPPKKGRPRKALNKKDKKKSEIKKTDKKTKLQKSKEVKTPQIKKPIKEIKAQDKKKLHPKERFKSPETRKLLEDKINGEVDIEVEIKKPEVATVRRRSNRIKVNRWEDADIVLPPPLPPPMPISVSTPPPISFFDADKPVKVKSRWRRTSELEMGAGLTTSDSDTSVSSISAFSTKSENQSPCLEILPPPQPAKLPLVTIHPEIDERLKSFEQVTHNIFLTTRFKSKEAKRMICDCTLTKDEIIRGEKGCGDDCLNRLLMIECGSRCALGALCSNKRFQNLENSKLEVVKTVKKGLGLVSSFDIDGGEFLMEYVGEVLDPKEFRKRAKEYSKEKTRHFYFMALKSDSIIDATQKGNISRFINHSCDPNSETQKWMVNGELRIGFFSKRGIAKGEEVTFDYQFQRYGKEAQRCYCESSNCRGWLGEVPEKENEKEIEERDEEDNANRKEKKDTEIIKEKDENDENDKDEKEDKEYKEDKEEKEEKEEKEKDTKEDKEKKKKDERRKDIIREYVNEMDLEEEIEKLSLTGVKNQAHTLMLSRLMVRAENLETKGQLLDIALAADKVCLRLFLDYHGLALLWSWMIDNKVSVKVKIQLLKTLELLPITNKTILKDSKVLEVVEKWANPGDLSVDKKEDSNDGSPDSEEAPKNENSQDSHTPEGSPPSDEETTAIIELAKALIAKWADLKEEFRIPKKERIEQMKEHEREANRGYSDPRDNDLTYTSRGGVGYRHWPHERDGRNKDKEKRRGRDSPDTIERRNRERNGALSSGPRLSKLQRRKLFALQVEEEERKKRHFEDLWNKHQDQCSALGLDPSQTPLFNQHNGFPGFYHPQSGSWQPLPPGPGYPMQMPPMVRPIIGMPQGPMPVGPPMAPMGPMVNVPPSPFSAPPPSPFPALPPSPFPAPPPSPYHTVPQFSQPPPPIQQFTAPPPITFQTPPPNQPQVFQYLTQPPPLDIQLPPVPKAEPQRHPPLPRKLPPKWKTAKDKQGRFYFYHIRVRQSQWHYPTKEEIAQANSFINPVVSDTETEEDESETDDDDSSSEDDEYKEEEEDDEEEETDIIDKKHKIEEELPILPGLEPEESSPLVENEPVLKKRREGLVQVNIISPRDDDLNYRKGIKKSKIRETKEKLARAKHKHKKERSRKSKDESAISRRIKDKFRVQMANTIVTILNPYRKSDCKVARIQTTEDFKHLARKLTHFVMVKELKHCSAIQELECNDNVKHKAKDFIKKYMAKFGSVYSRLPDEL